MKLKVLTASLIPACILLAFSLSANAQRTYNWQKAPPPAGSGVTEEDVEVIKKSSDLIWLVQSTGRDKKRGTLVEVFKGPRGGEGERVRLEWSVLPPSGKGDYQLVIMGKKNDVGQFEVDPKIAYIDVEGLHKWIQRLLWFFPDKIDAHRENPWLAEKAWGDKKWPDKFDAACNAGNGKIYFFSGSQYWLWDNKTSTIESGYPKEISEGLKGVSDNIDAATYGVTGKGDGKIYLFKDSHYWRWDIASNTMDEDYPMTLKDGWPGLAAEKINCAFRADDTHIIFISGDQAWYWDMEEDTLEIGPTPLTNAALLSKLPNDLDAALWDDATGSVDFFKGHEIWRMAKQADE